MKLSRRRSIGLALAGVAGAQFSRASAAERAGDAARPVSWDGLGTRTKIVGQLGKPLGDLLRIEGSTVEEDFVRDKGEDDATLFRVSNVDGKALEQPVVLQLHSFGFLDLDENLPPATPLSLLGYEDGGLRGVPKAAMAHLADAGRLPAAQSWHFATHFTVLEDRGRAAPGK